MGAFFYFYEMKKYIVLILVVFFCSCKIEPEITINKVQGSAPYSNYSVSSAGGAGGTSN